MKKLQFSFLCLCFGLLILSGFAHKNYLDGLMAASNSCGSDACIMEAMNEYGYSVDPLEVDEPTMADKVIALYKSF